MSEGINFADDHARAVVLLGIPFPAYKDTKVEQKKAYNDHKCSQARGLVTGTKWYNLQAFRAMNQVRTWAPRLVFLSMEPRSNEYAIAFSRGFHASFIQPSWAQRVVCTAAVRGCR